ncbi:MAG: hypothetical protein GX774_01325 [Armatimonadetes bacterium]|nr:hypothetical protein [Armatimonadota bacterium]
MKVISVSQGFTSDHSSTSYEFLAVDKPLSKEARSRVASLSRRANPTRRRVSFIYHVDGYDIPGGWKPLMRDYYDVMYSESYDRWNLVMAFNAPKEQQEALAAYGFDNEDGYGVQVTTFDSRVIVSVNCSLASDAISYLEESYEESEEKEEGATLEVEDELLNLLIQVRQQLMRGDYRTLYAVWEMYGWEEGEDEEEEWAPPPVPPDRPEGRATVEQFRAILVTP